MWIAWERAEVIRRRALGNQGEDNETGGEEEAECKVGTLTSGMFHNRILFVWDFRLNDVRGSGAFLRVFLQRPHLKTF